MYYIIYLSAAVKPPAETELLDILTASRRNNSQKGLTGVLLYGDGRFIQFIEGDKADVQDAFEKISNDSRHKAITLITSDETDHRNFPEWSMGFKSLNAEILFEFEGYLNPGKNTFQFNEDNLPVKLLRSFVRTSKL
jgi:hypothetical protein